MQEDGKLAETEVGRVWSASRRCHFLYGNDLSGKAHRLIDGAIGAACLQGRLHPQAAVGSICPGLTTEEGFIDGDIAIVEHLL